MTDTPPLTPDQAATLALYEQADWARAYVARQKGKLSAGADNVALHLRRVAARREFGDDYDPALLGAATADLYLARLQRQADVPTGPAQYLTATIVSTADVAGPPEVITWDWFTITSDRIDLVCDPAKLSDVATRWLRHPPPRLPLELWLLHDDVAIGCGPLTGWAVDGQPLRLISEPFGPPPAAPEPDPQGLRATLTLADGKTFTVAEWDTDVATAEYSPTGVYMVRVPTAAWIRAVLVNQPFPDATPTQPVEVTFRAPGAAELFTGPAHVDEVRRRSDSDGAIETRTTVIIPLPVSQTNG